MKLSISFIMEKSHNDFKTWLNEYSMFFEEAFSIMKYKHDVKIASSSNYETKANDWILFVTSINDFAEQQLSDLAIAFWTRGIIDEDDIYDVLKAVGYEFQLNAFDEHIKSMEENEDD